MVTVPNSKYWISVELKQNKIVGFQLKLKQDKIVQFQDIGDISSVGDTNLIYCLDTKSKKHGKGIEIM